VTDIVGEMAAASREQSAGVEQVNSAMAQMDHVTQSNSTQTDDLSSTAQSLSRQSARLLELISTFTLGQFENEAHDAHVFKSHETNAVMQTAIEVRPPVMEIRSVASAKHDFQPEAGMHESAASRC
jgi:hypothetical protein